MRGSARQKSPVLLPRPGLCGKQPRQANARSVRRRLEALHDLVRRTQAPAPAGGARDDHLLSGGDGGLPTVWQPWIDISYYHKQARHALPTKDPEVERTMRGIRRAKGMAPNGKAPLLPAQLRQAIKALPDTLIGRALTCSHVSAAPRAPPVPRLRARPGGADAAALSAGGAGGCDPRHYGRHQLVVGAISTSAGYRRCSHRRTGRAGSIRIRIVATP